MSTSLSIKIDACQISQQSSVQCERLVSQEKEDRRGTEAAKAKIKIKIMI